MRLSSSTSCAILLSIGSITTALRLGKRENPAVVSFPFNKVAKYDSHQTDDAAHGRVVQRADNVLVPDVNFARRIIYVVELTLGTPPQTIKAQLDTGSPSLIVHTVGDQVCTKPSPNPCGDYGSYTANASSTYEYLSSDLEITYGGGDGATGDRALDSANIGGASLTGLYLGLQYLTTINENVFGVLFTEEERDGAVYDRRSNVPTLLRDQGYIASRAYSLWTNDLRAPFGELLFGGVDTKKFYGNLVSIDLLPLADTEPPRVANFDIPLLSVSGTDGTTTTPLAVGSPPVTVNLDSGTNGQSLPAAFAQAIFDYVGAEPREPGSSYYLAPCSLANSAKSIDFHFAGVTIKMPLSQFFFPSEQDQGFDLCSFNLAIATGDSILGDPFLTSVYIVYDLDNKQVHLAQTVFNATESSIMQILAGPDSVPDAPGIGGTTAPASSSTSRSSSSTLSTSTTKLPTPPKCNSDNCFRAIQKSGGESAFCASVRAGLPAPTPTNIAKNCASLPARVSSGCSCYATGTSLPPAPATTTSTTSSTSKPVTPTKPAVCKADNCLRAVQKNTASASLFCSAYVATSPTVSVAVPTNIAKGCATLPSRISSACSCAVTGL